MGFIMLYKFDQNVVKYPMCRPAQRTVRSSLLSRLTKIIVLLFVTLCLPCQTTSAAEDAYYTWVDENGVTNFAQKDPKEYESTYVTRTQEFGRLNRPKTPESRKVDTAETPATTRNEVDPDLEIQEERRDIQEQIAKIRASNCDIGKRNLAKLEAYSRIRVVEDDGEERLLSDEEKQERTTKARNTITQNCVAG